MKINKEKIVEYFTPNQKFHPWSFSYVTLFFGGFALPFRFQWVEGVVITTMYQFMAYNSVPLWKFFILNLIVAAGANVYRSKELRRYTRKHFEEKE